MNKLPSQYPRNICAYCGDTKHLEDDHIPPKNLFPKPRPNNLITVPACKKCHSKTSKDDEYFRIKLSLRDDAGSHPSARKNWDSLFRGLNRKEAEGLRKSFLSDFKKVQTKTPSGLYAGKRLGYDVDLNRIRKVIERVVRGFYFAEVGKPLGFNIGVKIISNDDLQDEPQDFIKELKETILVPLASKEAKVIGDNIFSYRHHIAEEDSTVSVWGMSFYSHVPFLCLTAPDSVEQNKKDV
ncbi:MAG: HNH endonuclease [Desulfobulbaceae bacterium]|nr:HNH endonuclease [Desulfobulbaceae bacterium]HIJ90087.1 hypothetical protein [Deltaproteobacteria bacterium]